MKRKLWLVIPAAGVGKRFGADTPKQYQKLLGKTILEQTLARFSLRADIEAIIVAVAKQDSWISELSLPKNTVLVTGGLERADSVRQALNYLLSLASEHDLVAVHDAARPCLRQNLLDRLFGKAQQVDTGVIPVLMAKDTIKQVVDGRVLKTLDRNIIAAAQTPQVFTFALLQQALSQNKSFTDEASAVEALGLQPYAVEGDMDNIKITIAQDLQFAEFALAEIVREEQ